MSALKRDTARDHHRVIDPAEAEGSENNCAHERGHHKATGIGKSRRVQFEEGFPIQEVYRGDPEEWKPHMNVSPGWYPGDGWLEIPSRRIEAKLMVTTSNHVLVNMADFGDDLEIEGDVLAARRSHEDDDTSGGESGETSGTSASTESDADVVPEKRGCRGAYHKPRPPRKNNPPAFIQLSLALLATCGYTRSWRPKKLNGTQCAKLQTEPSHCCNLAARPLMCQQCLPYTRLAREDSTSLKPSQ